MKGNKIVSMLAYPDYNVYRVQVSRHSGFGGMRVRTYTCDYSNLKKVTRLSELAYKMGPLIAKDLIKQRRLEHGYKEK